MSSNLVHALRSAITEKMKIATSYAIANLIPECELSEDNIIISPLDKRVADTVANAVIAAAKEDGIARI